jgi:demethylmenaquinone methyltransferase/2-methoxy-6-polyprenyl-1,4-benzoquinol methylase
MAAFDTKEPSLCVPFATALCQLRLIAGNALALPFEDGSFDAVSISFGLRNMPDYAATLAEAYRVLAPGGRFVCLEASYPTNRLVLPPFKLYFKHWLPTLGRIVVKAPKEYAWLNTSTEAFLSKDELATLMRLTGFAQVSYTSLLLGAAALHRGIR